MSRLRQATIDFPARKSPRVSKGDTPVEKKLEKLMLKTPKSATPSKVRDSTPRSGKVSRNLFSCENGPVDVSPPKQQKQSELKAKENKRFSVASAYEKAKFFLNAAYVEDVVYRESECLQIKKLLEKRLNNKSATSLYISGAPGTGKTLCVDHVLSDLGEDYSFKQININCMDCRRPSDIYSRIVSEYGLRSPKTPKESLEVIEKKIVTPSKGSRTSFTIVVLDEIDKLESKTQEVLYGLFELPRIANSRLILIGIANTLDFTTRSLTRFQSLNLEDVTEMHFQPYTKDQVKAIIESRLKQVDYKEPLFNDAALELCVRKVSTHCGDVRKALDVCRRAIELVQSESKFSATPLKGLKQVSDDGLNPGSPRKRRIVDESEIPAQVSASHIMKVLNEVYGSKAMEIRSGSTCLPTQQQIILCSLLIFSNIRNRREVEVTKCYRLFARICTSKCIGYDVGNCSEFLSMCELLESKGFISIKPTKDISKKTISLSVNEEDIESAMSDKSLFKSIIGNGFSLLMNLP